MWVVILVFILSKPGEPVAFGVIGEFKSGSECVQTIAKMDITDDERQKLHCMELRKAKEI